MVKRKRTNLLLCTFLSLLVMASSEVAFSADGKKAKDLKGATKPTSGREIRQKMDTISQTLKELAPFIVSEQEFNDAKNSKVITKHLNSLAGQFKNLPSHPLIDSMGLSLNQAVMSEQLDQAAALFENNKKSIARAKFTGALNLCVSCHVQSDGKNESKLFAHANVDALKLSDFEKAEFYFISRDYKKAMSIYDQFIMKSKKTDDDEFIYKALGRQLVYYVRVQRNFGDGKKHFEKYVKAKILNEKLTDEVKEWVKTLGGKTLWENYDPKLVKEEDMDKFMKTFINDSDEGPIFTVDNSSEVLDLNLSTILLDYYNAHPETKLGGRILYWLAILDKRLNDELFFSLSDHYLLSCMEKYQKDAIASECYETYVEDLEIDYLSKEQKELPAAIKARLERLKKMINYKEN